MFAVTNLINDSEKVNVSIFAQEWDSFISPSLIEGRYPEGDDEVVVDQSFENYGIKLGDTIQLNGSEASYKIVGLTQGNKFFHRACCLYESDNLLDFTRNFKI